MTVAACPSREVLGRYLDGPLGESHEQWIGRHIHTCRSCQRILDELVETDLPVKPAACQGQQDSQFLSQLCAVDISVVRQARPGSTTAERTAGFPEIPNYQVLGELGRGGMGVVYRARHIALGREVAIKMLPAAAPLSEADRRRFKTEAETVARLQHPNIVQLFELGEVAGQPFLVLEYVDGGTLQEKLAGRPQPPRQAAALVAVLARAAHAAHEQHIIHRDLKPANVLLTDLPNSHYGIPKLTDFGLAKQLDALSEGMTRSLSGTPAYMAPEQVASGRLDQARPVTPATDVYALGVILYEMLTGRPPFLSPDWMATLLQVERNEPVSPRVLQPGTPRDLETVCLKCLEKDPGRRYAAAADLADDIDRYLQGKPTIARPLSRIGRAGKTLRRYPVVTGLVALVAVTLVSGLATALVLWHRSVMAGQDLERALVDLQAKSADLQAKSAQNERNLYFGRIAQAVLHWDAGDAERARELIASCEPAAGETDLRGWEWHYLQHLVHSETSVRNVSFWVNDLALLPTAPGEPDELAVALGVPLWNSAYRPTPEDGLSGYLRFDDSSPLREKPARLPGGCTSTAFQEDGPLIAWGTTTGHVVVMDRRSGRHACTIELKSPVMSLRFTRSNRLVSSNQDDGLHVLNPLTGEQLLKLDAGQNVNCVFAVNPSGTLLVCGGADKALRFYDTASWQLSGNIISQSSTDIASLAFSPDGSTLLSGGNDGTIFVWDVAARREIRRLEDHSGHVYAIAFHPNGKMFASGGADRIVRLWELGSTKPARYYRGHLAGVRSLIFSRNGSRLASGGQDQTIRMWNAKIDPRGLTLSFDDRLNAIALDETDSTIKIRADHMGAGVASWTIPHGEKISEFKLPGQGQLLYPVRYVDFLNRGRIVVAISYADPRTMLFYDASTGQRLERAIAIHGEIQTLAADPSGRWLVWAESNSAKEVSIRRWDEQTQKEYEPIRLEAVRIRSLVFDPEHMRIAAAAELGGTSSKRSLWILDANGHEPRRELCDGVAKSGAMSFGGERLAVALDKTISIYRTDSWELLHNIPALASMTSVCFSPDGRRLAAVGYDGVVVLADPATGTQVLQLSSLAPNRPGDRACDARVAFSADGAWLVSTNWNGSLVVRNGAPFEMMEHQGAREKR